MDARFESKEQLVLNQIIGLFNRYGLLELDASENLLKVINEIAEMIYNYAEQTVDVEAMLDKHNRLSVDIVLFPQINELIMTDAKKDSFFPMITKIINVLDRYQLDDPVSAGFDVELRKLLEDKHILHH